MASEAYGSIIIETGIDESGIETGTQNIVESAKRMAESVKNVGARAKSAIDKMVVAIEGANTKYLDQEAKVEEAKERLQEALNQKIPTETFKGIEADADALFNKIAQMEAELAQYASIGFNVDEQGSWMESKQFEIFELYDKWEAMQNKMASMKTDGSAYEDPTQTKEYEKALNDVNKEEEKADKISQQLTDRMAKLKEKIEGAGKGAEESKLSFKIMANGLSDVAVKAGQTVVSFGKMVGTKIASGLKGLFTSISGIGKSSKSASISFKTILKYVFGIRSLYMLVKKLKTAIKEAFTTMRSSSTELNSALNSMQSSLNALKGSLATAFAPIVTAVAPYISKFLDLITSAINGIGMLMSALTGKSTYMKAVKYLDETADATSGVADSASDAGEAMESYLSPLDELNKLESSSGSGGSGSGGSGGSGSSDPIKYVETPIASSVADLANQIRDLVDAQDWDGLGELIAEKVNGVFDVVYDAINWENVKGKITPIIEAFTETFNSVVDNLNWDKIGRTVGAGINTISNTLDLVFDGIDWEGLGQKLGEGFNGLVDEVDWEQLGDTIASKFMIAWDVFSGFVETVDWDDVGESLAESINGFLSEFDFSEITGSITDFLNGLFEAIASFDAKFSWDELVDNIGSGIDTALENFNWSKAGTSLGNFIKHLCNALTSLLTYNRFKKFGEGIASVLEKIPWGTLLKTVATLMVNSFGGLISGLASTPAGTFVSALVTAMGTNKLVTQFASIGSKFGLNIGTGMQTAITLSITAITTAITALVTWINSQTTFTDEQLKTIEAINESYDEVNTNYSTATSNAQTALGAYAETQTKLETLKSLVDSNGTVIEGHLDEAKELAGYLSEALGVDIEFQGNTITNYTTMMDQMDQILAKKQAQAVIDATADQYAEALEKTVDLENQFADAVQIAQEKQKAYNNALSDTGYLRTHEQSDLDNLYNDMVQANEAVDKATEAWTENSAVIDNYNNLVSVVASGTTEEMTNAITVMANGMITASNGTQETLEAQVKKYQETYNKLKTASDSGLSRVTQSQVDNAENLLKIAQTELDKFKGVYVESYDKVASNAEEKSAETANHWVGQFETTAEELEGTAKTASDNVTKNMSSATTADYAGKLTSGLTTGAARTAFAADSLATKTNTNITKISTKATKVGKEVPTTIANGITSGSGQITKAVNTAVSKIEGTDMSSAGTKVANSFGNAFKNAISSLGSSLYNAGAMIATRLSNGIKSVHIPVPTLQVDNYKDIAIGNGQRFQYPNFKISYLASGAVIPANKEFLAVLGDQTHGNNLEAPESLLRQIVREESSGAGSYRFTAQIGRRTLFDEIITEAKLRRSQTGLNPFEMA